MRLDHDDRSPVSKAASKDMYESLLSRMYVFKVGSLHVLANEQRKKQLPRKKLLSRQSYKAKTAARLTLLFS